MSTELLVDRVVSFYFKRPSRGEEEAEGQTKVQSFRDLFDGQHCREEAIDLSRPVRAEEEEE